jgi:Fic family protein
LIGVNLYTSALTCIEKRIFLCTLPRTCKEMADIPPLTSLRPDRFDRPDILKQLNAASRKLAELKGVAASMPNQGILIGTLGLQEAKDSSEIENIVTTHDELFREVACPGSAGSAAAKEVAYYRQALRVGFEAVRRNGLLTNNDILRIQAELERNHAGFRKLPGTALKGEGGRTVYTPPQNPDDILALMTDLERFINDDALFEADPLVKMALIHHQFESIHPFYDGNGRTGRIINVLYLVKQGLLDIPVLYLSRHIVRTKADYYRLLQETRDRDSWEEWVLYMLTAVERTAAEGIATIQAVKALLMDYKHRIRAGYRFYSQDLINNLFAYPYTKIEFVEKDLKVSRLTAAKYLEALVAGGFLHKRKIGRSNYYINVPLYGILTGESPPVPR